MVLKKSEIEQMLESVPFVKYYRVYEDGNSEVSPEWKIAIKDDEGNEVNDELRLFGLTPGDDDIYLDEDDGDCDEEVWMASHVVLCDDCDGDSADALTTDNRFVHKAYFRIKALLEGMDFKVCNLEFYENGGEIED